MSDSLAELQHALARHVLGGEASELLGEVAVPEGVDAVARLGVHAQGYPARLREALQESHPAISQILGQSAFATLTARYARTLTPGWRNLNGVGERLADHLATDPLTEELPFLPDLARLEWAVVECFNAEADEPFDLSRCADWGLDDWAGAGIVFQAGTALVASSWPIHALREARELDRSEIDVELVDRPERVLVHRDGFDVVARPVGPDEALAVECLIGGGTLGETMAALDEAGASPDAVMAHFGDWARHGLVVACGPHAT